MLNTIVGALLLTAVFRSTNADSGHSWGYPDLEINEGFPKWGGVCDYGKRQSPIDLSMKGALRGILPDLQFENYETNLDGAKIVNNGHSVQISKFPLKMKIRGGPLMLDSYVAEQLHFHWWSEHTIDKIRYPLEMHIVHRNEIYPNISEALKHKNGLAVVGILYHISNEGNSAIEKISEHCEDIKDAKTVNEAKEIEEKINLRELLPSELAQEYLTYDGSLTTPSCDESVKWIVMLETLPVTYSQINKFDEIEDASGKKLKNNYRETQKRFNRPVTVVLGKEGCSGSSTISAGPVSALALVSLLIVFLRK